MHYMVDLFVAVTLEICRLSSCELQTGHYAHRKTANTAVVDEDEEGRELPV